MATSESTALNQFEDRPTAIRQTLPGLEPVPLIRPFLKWAGGKSRLLPKLLPFVPPTFENYHEPFLGGGAMFFAVRARAYGRCYLSDLNGELMNAWLAVQNATSKLKEALHYYKVHDSEVFYYSLRKVLPTNAIDRAARFIYLNQTSWNGLWRVNRWGEFNVPWGQRSFRGFTDAYLSHVNNVLRRADLWELDFRAALDRTRSGDFVYLDPPYLPLSDTSKFYFYTERRFREPDLRELALMCMGLTKKRVSWVLSNRDTPLIRELFDHARVVKLTARRSLAAQNRRDVEAADSPEVIVIGGG